MASQGLMKPITLHALLEPPFPTNKMHTIIKTAKKFAVREFAKNNGYLLFLVPGVYHMQYNAMQDPS
jgi:hypothetical protein